MSELGYLDYKEIADSWLDRFNVSLARLAEANGRFANNLAKVKPLLQQNLSAGVARLSKYLIDFAETIAPEIEELSISREKAFDAVRKSLEVYNDSFPDNAEPLTIVENQLLDLVSGANTAYQSQSSLRDGIEGLPKWTSESISAQNQAVEANNNLLDELHLFIDTNSDIIEYIRKLKK